MLLVIDIGTNTVRLLVAEATLDGHFRSICHRQLITRLGADMTKGRLSLDRMAKTVAAIESFALNAKKFSISKVRVAATAAVRSAENSADFIDAVSRMTGFKVEVLTGNEEARLTSLGVSSALDPQPETALIFDLGGGSFEVCLCKDNQTRWQSSYPVGVVRMAESQEVNLVGNTMMTLQEDLKQAGWWDSAKSSDCKLVGTAGTVTTLAAMHLGMDVYDQDRINNLVLSTHDLQILQDLMAPLSLNGREALPGMEPGRGDLVPPGLQFILALMQLLSKEALVVSDSGLLEGLILDMMNPCMAVDT